LGRGALAAAGVADVVETVRGFGYRLYASQGPCDGPSEADDGTSRELRDASWQLQEAVIEVEHSGSPEQQRAATEVPGRARHAIFAHLAE
jgi:hypothetical protein